MEKVDFAPFRRSHPTMWSRMADHGWDSLDGLRKPVLRGYGLRTDRSGWAALAALPHIGPRRVLDLVNFIRDHGAELPWFEEWDRHSARWAVLGGCYRTPPVTETAENGLDSGM